MFILQHAVESYFLSKLLVIGSFGLVVAIAVTLRWGFWRHWRFWLSAFGLVLLPSLLLLGLMLSPPGGGAGFSSSAAAMGIGPAIAFSLMASPFIALVGFLVGWWIDRRVQRSRAAKGKSHANTGSGVPS